MIRLLWKEWHELKWYLIALALGPWPLGLLWRSELGQDEGGYSSLAEFILMLVLAFWAGTRMPGGMRPARFGVGWLPIRPWKVWLVKFAPGLIVAALLPLWMQMLHPVQWHDRDPAVILINVADDVILYVTLYTCTFAVSTLASSIVAILSGYALTVIVPTLVLGNLEHYGVRDSAVHVLLVAVALCVSFGVWTRGRGAGPARKTGVTVASASIGLVFGLLVLALMDTRSLLGFGGVLGKTAEYWAMSRHRDAYDVTGPRELASPDGRAFAYVCSFHDVQTRTSTHGPLKMITTAYKYRTGEIRIRDSHGTTAVLKRAWASPEAWLPNGSLLVATGRHGRPITLSEWDPRTGRLVHLATLPRMDFVIPDSTGDKIAVLTSPRRGQGDDLWMLDRRFRRLKLLRPGLSILWSRQRPPRWDRDRLIFYRDFRTGYWSIRADGADLRQVFPKPKEARGG